MTTEVLKNEYAKACEKYMHHVRYKYEKIAADIKTSGRRLKVGHHISWTHQYFPSLAKAFLESSDLIEYEIIHDIEIPAEVEILTGLGLNVRSASEVSPFQGKGYDILFFQHPYFQISDLAIDFYGIIKPAHEQLLSKEIDDHPLICFIPYAFTVIDDIHHGPVDGFHDLPIHNAAWKVYCESEWHLSRAKEKATLRAYNWVSTGYPKLDEIVARAGSVRPPGAPRIIWAPHHNLDFQGIPILVVHDYLVSLLQKIPSLQVVFRPHPNFIANQGMDFARLGMTSSQFQEILTFWQTRENCEFDFSSDLAELFFRSDLMITDCGGFQAEYLYSGKPLVSYIKRNLLNKFSEEAVNRLGYWCESIAEIDCAIENIIIRGSDEKLRARIEAAKAIVPEGGAARAVVKDIKGSFFR